MSRVRPIAFESPPNRSSARPWVRMISWSCPSISSSGKKGPTVLDLRAERFEGGSNLHAYRVERCFAFIKDYVR